MASLNKVSLLGRVGKDPEIRYSPQDPDQIVVSFSIATGGEKYTDKNGQQQISETQWHNCTAFKGIAKVISQYVFKGSQIYIDGKLKYEKYTSKDGVEKTATKIIVDNVILCGSKNENSANHNEFQAVNNTANYITPQQNYNNNNNNNNNFAGAANGGYNDPADIPF